ncbi:alpha/beta fold hydrolase [Serinicoccus kebangsaanensis]|uniref:alpha/beta fold hydrolase n=1 Tax=Serinicoccus kebangsaanensis TaxID=2602069 RepID=UPI00124C564C|nr:alpha/beta fold hydrolase [Serinicoccus kebangsaanensis]
MAAPRQRIHDPARRSAVDAVGLPRRPLPGLDPAWSRVVLAPDAEGLTRRWHVLDNGPLLARAEGEVQGTVLAVHGNPTWSYLWRRILDQAPTGWRVIAVDQLGMGWSERTESPRTLAQRVADLSSLTERLGVSGPVVTLAHDWGGPISLGWALRHRDQLAGVVLTNTAVHQPVEHAAPAVIRLARAPMLLARVCRSTPAFVRGTTALSVPPLPREVRDAFAAPYTTADRRSAVADFVRDIPFEPDHPSRAALDEIAAGTATLDVPALLLWGPRDPVFSERYLEDLLRRLPHADVQRYPGASHLVLEDRPEGVGVIWGWLEDLLDDAAPGAPEHPSAARASGARVPIRVDTSRPEDVAVVELGSSGGTAAAPRRVTFGELDTRVDALARGLAARGVRPGDRVAVLVPPGVDLTTVVYAVWRLGAVVVIADAGLGLGRLGAALAGARPAHVIGIDRALALAALTRVPGARLRVGGDALDELVADGARTGTALPTDLPEDADGAVLFTSGATGPPKGVVYTRRGLAAQVALLRDTFGFGPGERFVAAFAPFALYGPALGLPSAVPDMDVTAPHTLTAAALADAVAAVDATMVFAAPAALRNVVATADDLTPAQRQVLAGPRLVLSAGAPVPAELLRAVRAILTGAQTQTPYGMTEALPVATHDPTTPGRDDDRGGVCVGRPVPGVEVGIAVLDDAGVPAEELGTAPGAVGEIVVRGPHVKDRYDRQWAAQRGSARPAGWHRTGDVGHLDDEGRLWVEGRLAHVLTTADGPVTPYPVEDRVRELPGLADAAVVGVGPGGAELVVLVLVPEERGGLLARVRGAAPGSGALAPPDLAGRVRAVAGVPVAAVLVRDWLPVDVRHASKVDRAALADWADGILHGRGGRTVTGWVTGRSRRAPRTRSR